MRKRPRRHPATIRREPRSLWRWRDVLHRVLESGVSQNGERCVYAWVRVCLEAWAFVYPKEYLTKTNSCCLWVAWDLGRFSLSVLFSFFSGLSFLKVCSLCVGGWGTDYF